jgi:hypothetical protein
VAAVDCGGGVAAGHRGEPFALGESGVEIGLQAVAVGFQGGAPRLEGGDVPGKPGQRVTGLPAISGEWLWI